MNKVRVLIADDSPFIRQLFISFLKDSPDIEVVGKARTGQQVLDLLEETKPHVITMDYNMPIMDGLEALQHIMARKPIPVIMVSSYTKRGAGLTLEALELGAFDFITKPDTSDYSQLYGLKDELISKIKAAADQYRLPPAQLPTPIKKDDLPQWNPFRSGLKLIVIGTSSGGPRALKEIIPQFPATLPAAIIIVQHMPKGFTASLAQRLNKESPLTVKEAQNSDKLSPGLALVAPGDFHLVVDDDYKLILNKKAPLWGVRPAIDYTLQSAAPIFKENLTGIILTGMGKDGTQGLLATKEYGGRTIVESEETCTVFGMPRSAIEAGAADITLPLGKIPGLVIDMFNGGNGG